MVLYFMFTESEESWRLSVMTFVLVPVILVICKVRNPSNTMAPLHSFDVWQRSFHLGLMAALKAITVSGAGR